MQLISLRLDEAFRYMGYGQSEPDKNTLSIAYTCEKELLTKINIKYVYKYFDIESRYIDENGCKKIMLGGALLSLEGDSIWEHLSGCDGVVLMAVTLSGEVDRYISKLEVGSMTKAVVADSLANAAVEQACDLVEEEIITRFPDKYLTYRFSPGYGDLPLDIQGTFLRVLDAQKRIGVNLTDSGLMTPCKSVSAIIGISNNPINSIKKGCITCNMREKCQYREKGTRCGF